MNKMIQNKKKPIKLYFARGSVEPDGRYLDTHTVPKRE